MGWSRFWSDRAQNRVKHRKRKYGVEVPGSFKRAMETQQIRPTILGSFRLMTYVVFGSPLEPFRLFWRHLTDQDTPKKRRRINQIANDLRWRVSGGCGIMVEVFERKIFSRDVARVPAFLQKLLHRTMPLVVTLPTNQKDVLAIVEFAIEHQVSLFPRGASSWAFGGAVPTTNGIVVDLSSMREVINVDIENSTATVQAGIRWSDLSLKLEKFDLAPMTQPSSRFSTIGGWAQTGGLGIEGYGYGNFHDSITKVKIATPTGKLLQLNRGDDNFGDYIGAEGQLGIITELTFKLRKKSEYSRDALFYFESRELALKFLDQLVESNHSPSHVVFYDKDALVEQNRLFLEKTGTVKPIFKNLDAVFLHFDNEIFADQFFSAKELIGDLNYSTSVDATYLWAERYFPFKAQRLGPTLLACELLAPRKMLGQFIEGAKKLAKRFGVIPGFEAIVSKTEIGERIVLIASFASDFNRPINYMFRMLLVQLMMKMGVELGAKPYGYGIWNAPFIDHDQAVYFALKKADMDPENILNPSKSFRLKSRFFNIPGLFFRPKVFGLMLRMGNFLSPVIGIGSSLFAPKEHIKWNPPKAEEGAGYNLISQAATRCTHCGGCVANCPAYFITRHELVTGRAKLQLGELLLERGDVSEKSAHSVFQCLRCGLCEEVCQTRLPLRDCYLVIENWIEKEYSKPDDLVSNFVELVDASRESIARKFALKIARWSPTKQEFEIEKINGGGQ